MPVLSMLALLQAAALSPAEIVAAAPAAAWADVPAERLLVMELDAGRRVVIELAPRFAPVHVGNIRALAAAGWWNGAGINRVQDNYVVQWGDAKKALPADIDARPPAEYEVPAADLAMRPLGYPDPYGAAGFADGWPVSLKAGRASLAHCYGMVGAGRELAPDTGSGAELYAVIGHAPRHLDRNIALVGRVVAGMEHLASLPRGDGAMGFYARPAANVPIRRIVAAGALPAAERPRVSVLRTDGADFGRYLAARANRRDPFFGVPAGGADLCNVPVPVRVTWGG